MVRLLLRGEAARRGATPQSSAPSDVGKIIYISPIKALCSEKAIEWTAKFGPLGWRSALRQQPTSCPAHSRVTVAVNLSAPAIELTGDSASADATSTALRSATIICTTPEKFDVITRRWKDNQALIGQVALLLLDEVHMLNDDRGAVLEAVVSRMKTVAGSDMVRRNRWPASELRIMGLSATFKNIEDVGQWLQAPTACIFKFGPVGGASIRRSSPH